ncbi:MAG: hypothetical protein HY033_08345 [Ignavibacteriae bacterium]|nr:hypothetical protein [Ignavibacteria bacterium]MBI3364903.1 hypothetical protein [Ignavibacteriota bacterium]
MKKVPFCLCVSVLSCMFFFSSCKKEVEGTIDSQFYSPYLLSARLSEGKLNLDTTTSESITRLPDGRYQVSDSVYVQAIDPTDARNLGQCSFRIYRPGARSSFLTGVLPQSSASGNAASYTVRFTFTANRSDIGQYLVEAYLKGSSNFESNHLYSSLVLTRNNALPSLSGLSVPDTLRRPNSGTRNVFFAVTVSDSDGLTDIDKVFFNSINSTFPNFEQPMFDDGDVHITGDSVAHDGLYSRLLQLDSSATVGTKEFRFWARDKSGALSDSLVHFIVVVPE